MITNFFRSTFRIGRRLCRSELAVIFLVFILLWFLSKRLLPSYVVDKSTNFEAADSFHHHVAESELKRAENGAKELGFRHVESLDKGLTWALRYKNFGVYAVKGRRNSMEDRFEILLDEDSSVELFGIFDGHGGKSVAEEAEKHLLNKILDRMKQERSNQFEIPQIIVEETEIFDIGIVKMTEKNLTGSTALFALHQDDTFYVANLGDCRAIAVEKNSGKVVQLTIDHKPNHEREAAMVKKAGGSVIWNGVWRVGGILAVSRALGDAFLKIPGWVSASPEVSMVDNKKTPAKFILLASDGLWDVVSNEEAALVVNKFFDDDDLFGARQLVELALRRGSMDNITVMIVKTS